MQLRKNEKGRYRLEEKYENHVSFYYSLNKKIVKFIVLNLEIIFFGRVGLHVDAFPVKSF
jgi:hypothetical protein